MTETWLTDDLAERVVARAGEMPEARELLSFLEGRTGRNDGAELPRRVALRGLTGSARAWMAAWLERARTKLVLYVVGHGEAFEEARDDLEYFCGAGRTLAFPEPDQLPYDASSPHPAITAARLETLARLSANDAPPAGVVLTTARGLLQRVPSPERLARAIARIGVGQELDPGRLMTRLVFLGYERLP